MKKDHVGLRRRPFLTPIWLAAVAAAVVFSFATWLWSTADATTVIVVRHAEKESGNVPDPPLSAAGAARAALLARMLGNVEGPGHVDAIYVTATLRSRMTAAPLAARLGVAPVVVSDTDPRALLRRLLREHGGGRVLVVGHADTLPAFVGLLCAGREHIPAIDATEYGTMYVVTMPRIGRANLLRIEY